MENKKTIRKNRLYTLKELCELYGIEYKLNRTSRFLKKLAMYIEVKKQPRSNFYLVTEIKIRPEELE